MILLAIVAAGYQLFAILACLFRPKPATGRAIPASVLKPVKGTDHLREAIASHVALNAEILCGVSSAADPAIPILKQFPQVRIIESHTKTPNAKVGVLQDLAAAATHDILIVNDADIRVEPGYIERVSAPLADPKVGLVTCLYRPKAETFPARFEGLGVSTDFAPSTLVARMVGVDEFAMGSTLAFRRADLARIGGFAAIADYLADDYQLGNKIHSLGLKCVLSDVVVETHLGGNWRDVWNHQIRWARTIRVSRFWGYMGLPVTNGTLWSLILLLFGHPALAAAVFACRIAMAIAVGSFVLKSRDVILLLWAVPFRDLFGLAVWCLGSFGNFVIWRGRRLKLDSNGRILGVN